MWLLFLILLDLYLLAKIVETIVHIYDYYKMTKSGKEMAKIWEETIKDECNCKACQEDKIETRPTSKGKHAL